MKYPVLLLLSFFLLTVQAKSPEEVVTTEITCYDTETLFKTLKETFYEYPIAVGLTNDKANSTTTVWVSPRTKSWTIVATKESISCVIGTGTEFELVPYKKGTIL
jgi:hypothetical protein